jgi:hypothetical protein
MDGERFHAVVGAKRAFSQKDDHPATDPLEFSDGLESLPASNKLRRPIKFTTILQEFAK